MRALQQIGNEALSAFVPVLTFGGVTGLTVETDPLLRDLWRLRTRLGDEEWDRLDTSLAAWMEFAPRGLIHDGPDFDALLRRETSTIGLDLTDEYPGIPVDPRWQCRTMTSAWSSLGVSSERTPGVVFTVLYDPIAVGRSFTELTGTAAQTGFRVRFSPRGIATGLRGGKDSFRPLLGGISIGEAHRASSGTLGGCLEVDGRRYGVTCGHVIAASRNAVQPSVPDGGSVVGTCTHSTGGTLVRTPRGCTAYGDSNEIDAALIRFDDIEMTTEQRKLGDVSRVVPLDDVCEDELVVVSARSGQKALQVGALVLRRSVSIDGQVYCFRDLFELRRRGRWTVVSSLIRPTRAGDSGAWVLRQESDTYGWLGMVTAGDGPISYAQFADRVSAWAEDAVLTSPATAPTPAGV